MTRNRNLGHLRHIFPARNVSRQSDSQTAGGTDVGGRDLNLSFIASD
jgi:hypothetical protein